MACRLLVSSIHSRQHWLLVFITSPRAPGPSELSEVKTFALPISLQQEYRDGAQSLPWEFTSLPKNTVTWSPAQEGHTISPAPCLSFFFSRKVTLHLLRRCLSLDGAWIPSTCVCALQSSS